MRPITLTQTGAGSTANLAVFDHYISQFSVGIGVVVTGTVNYTVQHTYDNVLDPAVTPVWFDHATLAAQTANADGAYTTPVRASRLTVNSGTGTATATFIQAGSPNC